MAGGSGKRLWPLSRKKRPKQVLRLFDGQTLLRRCFDRISPVFDRRNILVLTNAGYVDVIREDLCDLPAGNVVAEPAVRDTASAIGLVSTILTTHDPEATMVIVTADQLIEPVEVLQQALRDALTYVHDHPESLVTFGIQPTFPNTLLGYIKCADARRYRNCQNEIYRVEKFAEKPDERTAKQYVESGQYFWNSGMFAWNAATILSNLAEFLPESVEPLTQIKAAWGGPEQQRMLERWFVKLPKISIDYAVMEKAQDVRAIRLDCRWLDIGGFAALAHMATKDSAGNAVLAENCKLLDCRGSVVVTEDEGHLIAAIGLDSLVIAHSPDATLVCPIDQAHRLKELVERLEKDGCDRFL
jgi:mannose-1-phosphate guanylyltransferase